MAEGQRRSWVRIALLIALAIGAGAYFKVNARPSTLTLTGIVTTDDVIVSPLVTAQLQRLLVKQGDTVARDQLLAVLSPAELQADTAFYEHNVQGYSSQIGEGEAALRYEQLQTNQQIRQAEAQLAAVEAQRAEAAANLENANSAFKRTEYLSSHGSVSDAELDQAKTTFAVAKAHLDALQKQVDAQRAAVALARASAEQVTARKSALSAVEEQEAAAKAQEKKADVRLGYTEIHAPIAGTVDVLAAHEGEVVATAEPILTLVDPDNLWVRFDVEESYIDSVRVGDQLTVHLPSGEERVGKVFFRGVDAGYATQRDVSRTKRDVKTFEVRLRVDNRDRRLALGMTMYVLFPVRTT